MRYRRKVIDVEARQVTAENAHEVGDWCGAKPGDVYQRFFFGNPETMVVGFFTPENYVEAVEDEWVIEDVEGNFYPCRDEVFKATYEPICDMENVPEGLLPDRVGPAQYSPSMLRMVAEQCNEGLMNDMPVKSWVILDLLDKAGL